MSENNSQTKSFEEFALVELFGHQKIVGKVTEATIAGGAFIRVDVPAFDGKPAFTRYYGPAAIYSLNPISEEVMRSLLSQYRNEPVHAYEIPLLAQRVPEPDINTCSICQQGEGHHLEDCPRKNTNEDVDALF